MKFSMKYIIIIPVVIGILFCLSVTTAIAQDEPNPRNAFLRSVVMPGWGHHYVDKNNWGRGQIHLGTEVILIASYIGLNRRVSNLEDHFTTLSSLRAGMDIKNRDRSFILAMGEFNTLAEYNQQQLITRNWSRLIEDQPENQWQWDSDEDRRTFADLRSNRDRLRNQLPALLSMMVVNRVFSGISAYNRARKKINTPDLALIQFPGSESGFLANISFRF